MESLYWHRNVIQLNFNVYAFWRHFNTWDKLFIINIHTCQNFVVSLFTANLICCIQCHFYCILGTYMFQRDGIFKKNYLLNLFLFMYQLSVPLFRYYRLKRWSSPGWRRRPRPCPGCHSGPECRVEHSRSQIQMEDHDVADASSLMS